MMTTHSKASVFGNKCLTSGCHNKSGADLKGLCMKCYSTAKKLVLSGETTWQDLHSAGLIDDPKLSDNPFLKAFNQKKGGQ